MYNIQCICFKIAGEGYFVFENLKCMLKGVHVEIPFYNNSNLSKSLYNNNYFYTVMTCYCFVKSAMQKLGGY